jgi:hypothetical protein
MTLLDQELLDEFGQHSVFCGDEDFGAKVIGTIWAALFV